MDPDQKNTNANNPFASFWMAGYECSDKLNKHRQRVDLLNTSGHLELIDSDYQLLAQFGIKTVREGIRWSFVEQSPYKYDWVAVEKMLDAGEANGIQQLWDICHFGFPDGLSPFHEDFTNRFVSVCCAFVKLYRSKFPLKELIITPINEVSYLSWLGGDDCGTVPYLKDSGWQVKYHLVKAYIAGIKAMLDIDPTIRILTTEPLVNMVAPANATPEQKDDAKQQHQLQFQVLEMLCGNICPELGGKPRYLDILGFNYYYNNQWVIGQQEFLPWVNVTNDERWRPLSSLLTEAYNNYNRPFVITETSHSGDHRPDWMNSIAEEAGIVLDNGFPLLGVCLYPIIDRPDWDDLDYWHKSGLWDAVFENGKPVRVLHKPYANALKHACAAIEARSLPNSALS